MSKKKAAQPDPNPPARKPLRTMKGLTTPPLMPATRIEVEALLIRVREGESLPSPVSEPMPSIGRRCHELRLSDESGEWRFFYQTHADHVLLIDWDQKKTRKATNKVLDRCKRRVKSYEAGIAEAEREAKKQAKRFQDKPEP